MDIRDPIIENVAAILGVVTLLFGAIFTIWPEFRTTIISAIRNHKWLSITGIFLFVGALLFVLVSANGEEVFTQDVALQRLYNDKTLKFDETGLAITSDGSEIRKLLATPFTQKQTPRYILYTVHCYL